MKVAVKTLDNKAAGEITLSDSVFAVDPRSDVLARVVNWQLAKRRSGAHKVKGRGEIRCSTAKQLRQKGSGRARRGAPSVSQYRGGGTTHGPVVRSHEYSLPKKVRRLGLKSALSAKVAGGKMIVIDALTSDEKSGIKTAALKTRLAKLGANNALIIGGAELDSGIVRAAGNLPFVDVLPQQGINVYDILRRDILVLSKDAAANLEERLK